MSTGVLITLIVCGTIVALYTIKTIVSVIAMKKIKKEWDEFKDF